MQVLSNAGQDQVHLVHQEAAKYMGSEEAVPSKSSDSNHKMWALSQYTCIRLRLSVQNCTELTFYQKHPSNSTISTLATTWLRRRNAV